MKVHERSQQVSDMMHASQAIRDLIQGTVHMRACDKTYLPKFPMESEEDYKARREASWLFNGTKKARDDMAGKVFEKPVTLADQSGVLFEWAQNIDLEGRDLSNFAQDVFRGAVEDGISFIMVDAPPRQGAVTEGEARARNLRPYMSLVRLSSVLGWKWETIDNAPTLTQWRMMERIAKPDRGEYSDETIEQIRVLALEESRVVVRLFQERKSTSAATEWVQVDEIVTEMTELQIVPVYTGRTGFFQAEPPLSDIAQINLAHWRVQSDKSNCLHKALSPLLLVKGVEVEDGAVASAGYAFHSSNEIAALEWAEITGSGIAQGTEELKQLEQQMKWSGLQLIMERTAASTATGDTIDESKSTTRLKSWADNLKDALEIAFAYMIDMAGIAADTTVMVHKEFAILGHMSLAEVRDMFLAGVISAATYIAEAQRRGVLSEDVVAEDEAERFEASGLAGIPRANDDEGEA